MFKTLALSLILFILLIGQRCNTISDSSYDYDSDLVSSVVSNHKATIVFVWTEWCQASQITFERDVIPYLNDTITDIGLILMYFGEIDDIPDTILDKQIVMNSRSFGGFDKFISNRRFKRVFKGYKNQNCMPMSILVDSNGVVLNYLANEQRYAGFGNIIWSLRHPEYYNN